MTVFLLFLWELAFYRNLSTNQAGVGEKFLAKYFYKPEFYCIGNLQNL